MKVPMSGFWVDEEGTHRGAWKSNGRFFLNADTTSSLDLMRPWKQPVTDCDQLEEGWIKHTTGTQPVGDDVVVEIKMYCENDVEEGEEQPAKDWFGVKVNVVVPT